MPGIVRQGDSHVGHASPTPSGFHRTTYVGGSPNVFVNGKAAIRITDTTACGDPAVEGSKKVFVNKIGVHRLGDDTGGHGSFTANSSSSSSTNVLADGGNTITQSVATPDQAFGERNVKNEEGVLISSCNNYDFNNDVCLDT